MYFFSQCEINERTTEIQNEIPVVYFFMFDNLEKEK